MLPCSTQSIVYYLSDPRSFLALELSKTLIESAVCTETLSLNRHRLPHGEVGGCGADDDVEGSGRK